MPAPYPNAGPVGLLAAFAETIGQWFDMGMRYWRHHTNAYALQLLPCEDGVTWRLRFGLDRLAFPPRQQMEYALATTAEISRALAGLEEEAPVCVRFQHHRPADTTPHEALFRCPVEFSAPHNEIVFDGALLHWPLRGRMRPLRTQFGFHLRHRIRQTPLYDQSMKATVALAISILIGTGLCTLDTVALALGMSPKKLQRVLAQENATFSDILEETRQSLALRLLTESNAPIASIAGLLEYSSATPFTLAFRRWTGTTPRDYRVRLRQAGPPPV